MALDICGNCKRTVMEVALHRSNPKGEVPAEWLCRDCHPGEIDPVVKDITEAIQGGRTMREREREREREMNRTERMGG